MPRAGPFSAWERSIAVRYLRAKRSEGGISLMAVITFLGIMLAVFGMVTVLSIMNGFRTQLLNGMLGFSGHAFIAGPVLAQSSTDGIERREAIIRQVRALPNVTEAVPLVKSQALAQSPIGAAGALVRGIRPEDLRANPVAASISPRNALDGFGQGEEGGDVILIGERLAQALGVQAGDEITLTSPSGGATAFGALPVRKTYVVGGTFSVGVSDFDQIFIYMPLAQAQLFFSRGANLDVVEIKTREPDQAVRLRPDIQRIVGSGGVVTDWTQRNRAYFTALAVERNTMRFIFGIVVLVVSMNVISGMIMLVKNKTRDIAIMRTMGATRYSILRIFFMAGSMLGLAGTAAGTVLAVLFCINIESIQQAVEYVTGTQVFSSEVYQLSHVPARLDWTEVSVIAVLTCLTSLVFTLPAAFAAASLEPVEALRYE